jgi:DNA-binding response OmpR family regulator
VPGARPASILLIEDNHGDVMLFQEAMEVESRNVDLHVAKSVDEGIRLLSARKEDGSAPVMPSIILLDLHLPGKDGKAFLHYLNEHSEFMRIPVIMLSSSTRQKDVDDCLRLGSWRYRVKPQDWTGYQELIAFLRQFWAGKADVDEAAQSPGSEPLSTPRASR